MAGARRADRREQVLLPERLDEIAEHAGLGGTLHELVLAVGREHHDRDRALLQDPARGLDPVELRHLHVQHGHVRLLRAGEPHGLLAVSCLCADFEAGAFEERPQIEADDRLVLGDEDAHGRSLAETARPRDRVGAAGGRW